jgi:ribosome-binding factor A
MSKKYQRRVSGLILTHLTDILRRKVSDPRLQMVNITGVEITPDAARADVYYNLLGGGDARTEAQDGLEGAASWLRHELGGRLRLRNTPELVFHYDPSVEHGEHIANILDELGLGDKEDDAETDALGTSEP